MSLTLAIKLSPVSLSPAINLSPVSTTPAIVDTSNKFFAGVVDTAEQHMAGVVDTGDKHSFLNISANFAKKFKTAPMEHLGAWGTLINEKNLVPLTSACSTCQREKNPQLIPKHKHWNTLCGIFLLYPSLTELPSIEIK